jgi:hypothetical protein
MVKGVGAGSIREQIAVGIPDIRHPTHARQPVGVIINVSCRSGAGLFGQMAQPGFNECFCCYPRFFEITGKYYDCLFL